MTRVRGVLGPIAAWWLVCQAATLVLVLVAPRLTACTCPLGADATCPMHHGKAAEPKACAMQSVTANAATTLSSLFSGVGLVPVLTLQSPSASTASPIRFECSRATERPSPPDPPPPRA